MYQVGIILKDNKVPYYQQICDAIRNQVKIGNLRAGQRLPSTRLLAENLSVSRSTVQFAYDQLCAEGYVEARDRSGYYLTDQPWIEGVNENALKKSDDEEKIARAAGETQGYTWDIHLIKNEERIKRDSLSPRTLFPSKKGSTGGQENEVIDFSPRGVDEQQIPIQTWKRLTREVLSAEEKTLFSSGDPQGEEEFREAIASYLRMSRGVVCSPDQVMVGAGCEYLLFLLTTLLGDGSIAMEKHSYKRAAFAFRRVGREVIIAPSDENGFLCKGLWQNPGAENIRLLYTMPSHQYPYGTIMPEERRRELISCVAAHPDCYILEDDYDSEFRYEGKPIPALQGMDPNGRVIYMGTFSRSVAPAIRMAYLVLPLDLYERYSKRFRVFSSTVSKIDQKVMTQFLRGGYFERHLNKMRRRYREKHDYLLSCLEELKDEVEITGMNAGIHVLATSRNGRSEEWLTARAREQGVEVYGLSLCATAQDPEETHTVLLGFSNLSEEQIAEGIRRLKAAWREE